MESNTVDLLACARALDRRLHETLDEPFRLPRGRLYGVTDDAGDDPYRLSFLGEHRDVYELVAGPVGVLARQFDAAVVAVTGWGAPLDDIETGRVPRPSVHPDRHRIRACCAVGDAGVASVMRSDRAPEEVLDLPDPGFGAMPEALLAMWADTSITMPTRWPDPRSVSRAAGRHRRPA